MSISAAFSSLTSAITAGNLTAAAGAATALQGVFGTSQAVIAQATSFLNSFSLSQATGNIVGMQFAVQGLVSMQAQLPTTIGPLLAVLSNPALQKDSIQSALAVANIQTALAHSASIF